MKFSLVTSWKQPMKDVGRAVRCNPSNKRAEGPHDVRRLIRLPNELNVPGHLRVARSALPAGDDDVDGWPSIPNGSGQFQSIHRAGHFDIGENRTDVVARFEDFNRLIRSGGAKDLIPFGG
jgi:hypothetical protein